DRSGQWSVVSCFLPLVSNLLPLSFRSSSQLSGSHGPGFAKLNRREGAGGWSPLSSDRYQWLEVDLGGRTQITAVSTQGRYGSSDWLTAYLLMFSDTGHNWKQHRQEDSIGAFPGNSNADSVVQHKLQHPVITRYVRLIPLDWNPNGRIGLRLETYGCPYNSDVVSLDGQSSLLYRLSPRPKQMTKESISLIFKTLKNSGTLLHAEGQSAHSLTLELEKGKLLLLLRQGRSSSPDSHHLVSLGSLLDDQHWHHVAVEHHSTHLNLTVDKSTLWVQIPPTFTHWDHSQVCFCLSRCGIPLQSHLLKNFHGCLENLVYNGVNLVDLAKQKDQRVTGNVTFSCAEPVFVAMTFTGPQSFLWLPGVTELSSTATSVGLQFRTWNKAGLLLTFNLPKQGAVVWLYLSRARLHLQILKSGRAPLELSAGSALNDGQWHSVELISRQGHLTVSVDEGEGATAHASPPFLVTTGSQLFFGAIFEQSCEAYKHKGNMSGYYYIDVDGSGHIRPQLIYCDMTEDKTWMVIQHNNTDLTTVRPSPGKNQHMAHFEYTAEEKQLAAVIGQSEHCEQELTYHCRKSRLLNTPGNIL
uniref:Contactin associated protein like 3 n=1 Tax=Sander lucioperca TaxID=283035 RepID=A0A8C9ZKY9_SANLU